MPAISKDPNVKSLFVYCAGSLARYFQVHEGGGKAAKKGSNFFCAIVIAHIHSVPFRSFLPPSSFPSPFVPCTDADAAFSWFSALPTAVRFSGMAAARAGRPSEGILRFSTRLHGRPAAAAAAAAAAVAPGYEKAKYCKSALASNTQAFHKLRHCTTVRNC